MDDFHWMQLALQHAQLAAQHGDVPVGAIAVKESKVIATGRNQRELDQDPTAHAELIAIRAAAKIVGHWRLEGVTLYCTLEPCAMCAGAMVLARLPRLVFATADPKAGAGGSVMDIINHPKLNHRVDVTEGVLRDEAAQLLVSFFKKLRAEGQK